MSQFGYVTGRLEGFRGSLGALPQWGRVLVAVAAIPGVCLAALSLLGFLVSILALLLLTLPVYLLLKRMTGPAAVPMNEPESPGVKRVEATVVE